jgi:hypothetical protein
VIPAPSKVDVAAKQAAAAITALAHAGHAFTWNDICTTAVPYTPLTSMVAQ